MGTAAVSLAPAVQAQDSFAVRIAAQHVQHDGYLTDGTNDDDTTSARLRALWEPSADVTLKLGFDFARVRGNGPGSVVFPFRVPGNPWAGALDPRVDSPPARISDTTRIPASPVQPLAAPHNKLDQWSANAQLDWNLGFATFTFLPSYRHEKIDQSSMCRVTASSRTWACTRPRSKRASPIRRTSCAGWSAPTLMNCLSAGAMAS